MKFDLPEICGLIGAVLGGLALDGPGCVLGALLGIISGTHIASIRDQDKK